MRITNKLDIENESPLADLFQVQSEFQSRITEEYLKYLRQIQSVVGPYTPGTILAPEKSIEITSSGTPGERTELAFEVENRQQAYCMVNPMLTPLIEVSGITWFPAVEASPMSTLLAPGEVKKISIQVKLPKNLSLGTYHGALLLIGFRGDSIPIKIDVDTKSRARKTITERKPRTKSRKKSAR